MSLRTGDPFGLFTARVADNVLEGLNLAVERFVGTGEADETGAGEGAAEAGADVTGELRGEGAAADTAPLDESVPTGPATEILTDNVGELAAADKDAKATATKRARAVKKSTEDTAAPAAEEAAEATAAPVDSEGDLDEEPPDA